MSEHDSSKSAMTCTRLYHFASNIHTLTCLLSPLLLEVGDEVSLLSILPAERLYIIMHLLSKAFSGLSGGWQLQHDSLHAQKHGILQIAGTLPVQIFQP